MCDSDFFASAKILNKYDIKYFNCGKCGFIQTEDPYWLKEIYSDAIKQSDIGLLKRNIDLLNPTRAVIKFQFNKKGKFVDYGAGYGIFVRMMRDAGFDFYWSDKYCDNLFAKDFEAADAKTAKAKYEMLTAYEVFEHLEDPIQETEEMLKYSDSIMFSTYLLPSHKPKPGEWWYYGPDHGQHISIYTKQSLKILGGRFNLNLYSNDKSIHLLSKRKLNGFLFKALTFPYAANLISPVLSKKSLLDDDYKTVLLKLKEDKA